MKRLLVASVLTAMVLSVLALPGGAAEPAPDHVVHAGAVHPSDELSIYMYQDYYPRHLKVHRGERVRWEFPNQAILDQAWHTVTFGDPDEAPWSRADEVPGTFAFDERSFFTTGCGRPDQPVCVISSTDQFVSSGTPLMHAPGPGAIEPFDAVIDLPEGTYSYFCTIHHPAMQGTVEVVADDVATDNPAPGDFAAQIEALTVEADTTFADLSQPELSIEDGRVWTVLAGGRTVDEGPASVEAFLPSSLTVRVGDTVKWVPGDSAHAVAFPDVAMPLFWTLNCEYDDPASGAPGVPAIGIVGVFGFPWCPPGGTMEIALTDLAVNERRAPGDAVVSEATLHSSGIIVDPRLPDRMRGRPPGSGEVYPSQFEASFPVPGTYTYRCLIHFEFMGGSITVEAG